MAKASTSSAPKKKTAKSSGSGTSRAAKPRQVRSTSQRKTSSEGMSAADALVKLIESPLVAELLTVGATAALAALAESRFGRTADGRRSTRALKAAGKAAAAAMGRRIATEIEEIRGAATRAKSGAAD